MFFTMLSDDATSRWMTWVAAITATLTAIGLILGILGQLGTVKQNVLRPAWNGPVKPFIKFITATASLVIPNGFFIGAWTFYVTDFYLEMGRVDFIITNPGVFWRLLACQTGLVSLYSFLWAILLYPRISDWFVFWRRK